MKISIELEAKEFFAIAHSLKSQERRRMFGTINLGSKIKDQLETKVSSDDLFLFEEEWKRHGKTIADEMARKLEEIKRKALESKSKKAAKKPSKKHGAKEN